MSIFPELKILNGNLPQRTLHRDGLGDKSHSYLQALEPHSKVTSMSRDLFMQRHGQRFLARGRESENSLSLQPAELRYVCF